MNTADRLLDGIAVLRRQLDSLADRQLRHAVDEHLCGAWKLLSGLDPVERPVMTPNQQKKFELYCGDVSEFIADWSMRNHHPVRFEDIERAFPSAKRKLLKRAWKHVTE